MTIRDIFEKIGLSDREISVFIKLLELGPQTVGVLSKTMDMPRSTGQFIIDKLEDTGLVQVSEGKGVKTYRCVDPRDIVKVFQQRRNRLRTALGEFRERIEDLEEMEYREKGPLPAVQWIEGKDAVTQRLVYLSDRHGDPGSQCLIFDPATTYAIAPHLCDPTQYEESDTDYRELVPDTPFSREYIAKFKGVPKSAIKLLPPEFKFTSNVSVMDGRELRMSVMEDSEADFLSIRLENEQITQQVQSIFNYLWKAVDAKDA